jgi:hypothetical protein
LETANLEIINTTADHFETLYDAYFDAIDDKVSKHFINENFKKLRLAHKLDILIKCYENLNYIYIHGSRLSNFEELESKLIETINILNPKAKIKGTFENKIKIIEQLILINTNELKKIEVKQSNGNKANFISLVVSIELALNFTINTRDTSVAKFIEYYKKAKKVS